MPYRFDPTVEHPTMLIQVQPHRYVTIADTLNDKEEGRQYHPSIQETMKEGKTIKEWNFGGAEVWVPERIGNNLVNSTDKTAPVAKLIHTRSIADAENGIDPRNQKKKRRRKVEPEENEDE